MKPLISVIVPIYKVEKYLTICVDSLLHQSYGNLEIILVDDGSPDECPAICDQYQNKDNRIKVIHKKNGGLSDARNAGLDIAQGEYVAFVDSDDFIDEDYICKLYDALQQNRASIAVCGIQIIDESNKVTEQIYVTQDKKQELYTGRDYKKELQGEWVLVTAWGLCMMLKFLKNCVSHVEDITKMNMCLCQFMRIRNVWCVFRRIYTTIYNVQIPLWELLIKNRIAWIILKCGMSG